MAYGKAPLAEGDSSEAQTLRLKRRESPIERQFLERQGGRDHPGTRMDNRRGALGLHELQRLRGAVPAFYRPDGEDYGNEAVSYPRGKADGGGRQNTAEAPDPGKPLGIRRRRPRQMDIGLRGGERNRRERGRGCVRL